jgi:hypothetical protein
MKNQAGSTQARQKIRSFKQSLKSLDTTELAQVHGGAAGPATPDFGGFKPGGPLVRTYGPILND